MADAKVPMDDVAWQDLESQYQGVLAGLDTDDQLAGFKVSVVHKLPLIASGLGSYCCYFTE
jgi:hypothetical protein